MGFKIENIVARRAKRPKMNIAIYSPPGFGKTYLAGTAALVPEMCPILAINVGRGIMTLEDFPNIDVASDIEELDDLEELLIAIRQGDARVKKYRTIIIDDFSEATKMGLNEYVSEREQKYGGGQQVQIQDYNRLGLVLSKFMIWARDSDKNIIFTAWAKEIYPTHDGRKQKKEELEPIAIAPQFPSSIRNDFEGYFDCLWYLHLDSDEDGDSVRYLVTQPTDTIRAKTRRAQFAAKLGTFVEDPTFERIWPMYVDYFNNRGKKKKKKGGKKGKKKGKRKKKTE